LNGGGSPFSCDKFFLLFPLLFFFQKEMEDLEAGGSPPVSSVDDSLSPFLWHAFLFLPERKRRWFFPGGLHFT